MISKRPNGGAGTRCLIAATLLVLSACNDKDASGPTVGSETHFLVHCETSCPDGAQCLCGACSKECTDSAACSGLHPQAQCAAIAPRVAEGRCTSLEPAAAMCDVACLTDENCTLLGPSFSCRAGYCRSAGFEYANPDAGVSVSCEPLTLAAGEVLVLGDSLIELSSFATHLEQAAIASAALAQGEHFRVHASSLMSMLAEGSGMSIRQQYAAAREEATARLVIMDGGETDVLNDVCGSPPSHDCPAIQAAVSGAQKLLLAMVEDGVEHIAYFFYPDPNGNDAVKLRLDVLRPLIENVCGQLPIACHWVDLRPVFADHPEYLAADGLVFSDQGATAAAEAIWQRLQQRCVVR